MHMEPTEQLETYTEKLFNHITRLIKERDDYFEVTLRKWELQMYKHCQNELIYEIILGQFISYLK